MPKPLLGCESGMVSLLGLEKLGRKLDVLTVRSATRYVVIYESRIAPKSIHEMKAKHVRPSKVTFGVVSAVRNLQGIPPRP